MNRLGLLIYSCTIIIANRHHVYCCPPVNQNFINSILAFKRSSDPTIDFLQGSFPSISFCKVDPFSKRIHLSAKLFKAHRIFTSYIFRTGINCMQQLGDPDKNNITRDKKRLQMQKIGCSLNLCFLCEHLATEIFPG